MTLAMVTAAAEEWDDSMFKDASEDVEEEVDEEEEDVEEVAAHMKMQMIYQMSPITLKINIGSHF